MNELTITLPESLREYVERRVAAGEFGSPSDFFRDLVERDRVVRTKLEALLLEGLESGKPIEIDDDWWAARHAELKRRVASSLVT